LINLRYYSPHHGWNPPFRRRGCRTRVPAPLFVLRAAMNLPTLRQRVLAYKAQAEQEFIGMLADCEFGKDLDTQADIVDLLAEVLLIPWREA